MATPFDLINELNRIKEHFSSHIRRIVDYGDVPKELSKDERFLYELIKANFNDLDQKEFSDLVTSYELTYKTGWLDGNKRSEVRCYGLIQGIDFLIERLQTLAYIEVKDKFVKGNAHMRYLMSLPEPAQRITELEKIKHKITEKKELGEIVSWLWVTIEKPHVNIECWKKVFEETKGYNMNKAEQDFFDTQPELITIYRGITAEYLQKDKGVSWTLDEKRATRFSEKEKGKGTGVVRNKEIKKADAHCYFERGGEKEIIYIKQEE